MDSIHNAFNWGKDRYKLFDILFRIFGNKQFLYEKAEIMISENDPEGLKLMEKWISEGDFIAKMRLAYAFSGLEGKENSRKARSIADEFVNRGRSYGFPKNDIVNFVYDIYCNIEEEITKKELGKMVR